MSAYNNMKYRPEIDGLRALAVVPVILFHAGFELFSGGFVGVDVFFVISGYLITTILIEDIENKRFSIVNFYERRARRILPALFFVMLVCIPFAWMLLSDAALNKFGNGLIGVSLFISNVVFWKQQGYFDESAELNPLLHTWSLAVEEQYYVLFPIFLILAWRFGKNRVFWMIVVMAAISLLLSEWGWRNKATANFYLAPTRAWELFAGSIAAFVIQRQGVQKNNLLSLIGLAAIVFSILFYDDTTPFPSVYALLPVLGVVLLLLHADSETFAAKLLSTKGFVAFGLISYSAYLWHQPFFAFFRIYKKEITLNIYASLGLVFLTFVIAYLSWRFVEKPFRSKANFSKLSLFLLSLASLLVIYAFGYISKQASVGGEYRLAYDLSENDYVYFENLDERKFIEGRLYYPLSPVNSVVVGSSRIMQIDSGMVGENIQSFTVSGASVEDDIAFGLEALAKLNYENIYISADPWLLNLNDGQNRYQSVDRLFEYWLNSIASNHPPIQFLGSNSVTMESELDNNFYELLRNYFSLDDVNVSYNDRNEASKKRAYDGSLIYDDRYVSMRQENDAAFLGYLNYAMKNFNYDVDSIERLQSFVSYLKENNVSVTFILSPYHPEVYNLMRNQAPIFLELEDWYREFSEKHGINIIGSYDPSIVGCSETNFYDGMHPKNTCMQKLFETAN
jgi:peptidoglycan/LPS O-acetylase OafA/YrhL